MHEEGINQEKTIMEEIDINYFIKNYYFIFFIILYLAY